MKSDIAPLTQKRVSILHRHFIHACDKEHPFQAEDLIALRKRFAVNASVQKVPDSHKWLLKITGALENMTAAATPSERLTMRETVNSIYHDNRRSFSQVDPDSCRLGLQKIGDSGYSSPTAAL